MNAPSAFTQCKTVMDLPFSKLVIAPTDRFPLAASTVFCSIQRSGRRRVEIESACTCRCHSERYTFLFRRRSVGCSFSWPGGWSCHEQRVRCQPQCSGSCAGVDPGTQTGSDEPPGHVTVEQCESSPPHCLCVSLLSCTDILNTPMVDLFSHCRST